MTPSCVRGPDGAHHGTIGNPEGLPQADWLAVLVIEPWPLGQSLLRN